MIEMIAGGVVAQSVSVAAEIGIADLLVHGPRTTAQLATQTGREHVREAGVADRCTLFSGNFFEAVAPGADAYTMRHILHDWSDERCITILGNIRRVIPADGRLLVIETVVPAGNDPSPSKLFDMVMMALPDGMERSEAQFRAIFDASGFRLTGITPTASPVSVIEARPV